MTRIIRDCSACGRALVPLTILFLSSCGGGSTATDAAPAIASGTLAKVSGGGCGIEGSGSQIQSVFPSCTPDDQFTAAGTSLDPSGAPSGGPAFNLWVYGSNFMAGSVVRWNGSDRPTTVVDASTAEAQIPASDIVAPGTAAVTVFNPAPGGGSSNPSTFIIAAGGVFPQSVAVDPSGKFAYVANFGFADVFVGNASDSFALLGRGN